MGKTYIICYQQLESRLDFRLIGINILIPLQFQQILFYGESIYAL